MLKINELTESQLVEISNAIDSNNIYIVANIIDVRCNTCPRNYNNIASWVMENKNKIKEKLNTLNNDRQ